MRERIVKNLVRPRLGDRNQTQSRYNIGYTALRSWATEAGAVVKIGRLVRFDWDKLDADLERRASGA